jgi:rubrerythrin
MNTDGNTAAIERHLAEREADDALHADDLYCPECNEVIGAPGVPELCPHCGGKLEETP